MTHVYSCVDIIANEQNQLEYNAVMKLHVHLDDNKDGDVNISESEEVGLLNY